MLWMTLACTCTPQAEISGAPEASISWTKIEGDRVLTDEVAREAAAAVEAGEKPVAYLGAGWCAPCLVYKKVKDDPAMVAAHEGVRIIEIDADEYAAELPGAGFITSGIPFWVHLDEHGAPQPESITGGAWADNTVANMAPVLERFFAADQAP